MKLRRINSWRSTQHGKVVGVPMHSAVFNITFDCRDARRVARFWSDVTGYGVEEVDSPGNRYWVVCPSDGRWPRLVFVIVPEDKVVKNRVHLDVVPVDDDQELEVERLLGLGATIVDDRRSLVPGGWVVLADPEGNEFCVE
jgi:predicted enzyme related to lactoylglutathione lyase